MVAGRERTLGLRGGTVHVSIGLGRRSTWTAYLAKGLGDLDAVFRLEVLEDGADGSCRGGESRVEGVDICLLDVRLLLCAVADLEVSALVVCAVAVHIVNTNWAPGYEQGQHSRAADKLLELSLVLRDGSVLCPASVGE